MECVSSMYLRKTCPKCDTVVHVKRAACGCSHKFALKRKGRRSVENESVKRRRAVECEEVVMQRKDKERVRKVRERAGEMPEKTLLRRQRDRICKESMRASETCEESSERRAVPLSSATETSRFTLPPTCVSSFSSTTLMLTVTFWNTSKLSSDENVTVLDAVAMSAINDATSNFFGDSLIIVEVFSITSYPSP